MTIHFLSTYLSCSVDRYSCLFFLSRSELESSKKKMLLKRQWFSNNIPDRTRRMRSQQQKDTAMEVADGVCESEVMFDALPGRADPMESLEMHVCEEEDADSAPTEEPTNRSAAAHTGTETAKPRYSYRLVCKQVGLKVPEFSPGWLQSCV